MTAPSRGRPVAPWRRALPWLVAALLLGTIGVPSAAATMHEIRVVPPIGYAHADTNVTVPINMTDAPAYQPAYANVPQGSNVTFRLSNHGSFAHTFTVSKVPDVKLNPAWSPAQLDSFFNDNGSLANVSVAGGGTGTVTIPFPDSDALSSFEFVSVVPYQFQAGMYGFINVTSTGPGLLLNESTLNSLAFDPNVLAVNGTHYPAVLNVLVTNQGDFAHTFTVVPQSNVSITPQNYSGYFQTHAPLANVNVPATAGGTVWANFTVKSAGVYMYICTVTGHFQNGMYGFLYVGVAPPAPPTPPSTAIVEIWVLYGSFVLLGIGVVIAAVASFAGRFPRPPKTPGHGH